MYMEGQNPNSGGQRANKSEKSGPNQQEKKIQMALAHPMHVR